ncbi:MAG: GFA family protein [Pseudomonadota bacterium]
MGTTMAGGCQCGAVRYSAVIENEDAYLCHCRMCQRATGGLSAAFVGLPRAAVTWEREPQRFRSSPIAQRGFCSQCGTPLTFEFDDGKSMDLTVGSFDDPYFFKPKGHFATESWHQEWLDTRALPAKRTEDNKPLVERWMKAVGKLPD